MVTITFQGEPDVVRKEIHGLVNLWAPSQEVVRNVPLIESPKAAKKVEEPKAAPSKKAEESSAPKVESAQPSTGDLYPQVQDIIPKFLKHHGAGGRDKMVALLAEFGAKSGKELKASDHQAFLDKVAAMMA